MGCALWANASACAILFEVGSAAEREAFGDAYDGIAALHAIPDPFPCIETILVERENHALLTGFVESLPFGDYAFDKQ